MQNSAVTIPEISIHASKPDAVDRTPQSVTTAPTCTPQSAATASPDGATSRIFFPNGYSERPVEERVRGPVSSIREEGEDASCRSATARSHRRGNSTGEQRPDAAFMRFFSTETSESNIFSPFVGNHEQRPPEEADRSRTSSVEELLSLRAPGNSRENSGNPQDSRDTPTRLTPIDEALRRHHVRTRSQLAPVSAGDKAGRGAGVPTSESPFVPSPSSAASSSRRCSPSIPSSSRLQSSAGVGTYMSGDTQLASLLGSSEGFLSLSEGPLRKSLADPFVGALDCKRFISWKHAERITDHYTFLQNDPIAEGGYGCIYVARTKDHSGRVVAIKKVSKQFVEGDSVFTFKREVAILKSLDHPNICKLLEVCEDRVNLYLVLEYCGGNELFQRIADEGKLGSIRAASIVCQIASALKYCHARGIAHRDLKPENIVFLNKSADSPVKLIDFGFSTRFKSSADSQNLRQMTRRVGSLMYVAPEVLAGRPYSQQCDMWSLGVVVYVMLSGRAPFGGDNIMNNIVHGNYDISYGYWKVASPDCRDLVKGLLQVDPALRLTAEQVLDHRWVLQTRKEAEVETIPADLVTNLRRFGRVNQFRRVAISAIARQLDDALLGDLHSIFTGLDKDCDGVLSMAEMQEGFARLCVRGAITSRDVEELFCEMDMDRSGFVDYSEFIAAAVGKRVATRADVCWAAFRVFDEDGRGTISMEGLRNVLNNGDVQGMYGDSFCEQMMEFFDRNRDGVIDFDEFMTIMNAYGPRKCRSGCELVGSPHTILDVLDRREELMQQRMNALSGVGKDGKEEGDPPSWVTVSLERPIGGAVGRRDSV